MQTIVQPAMLQRLNTELHELAQPLTTVQCRLELGQILGDPDSLREAIKDALTDMQRVNEVLSRVRDLVAIPPADQ